MRGTEMDTLEIGLRSYFQRLPFEQEVVVDLGNKTKVNSNGRRMGTTTKTRQETEKNDCANEESRMQMDLPLEETQNC
jgi:hypothetical protein